MEEYGGGGKLLVGIAVPGTRAKIVSAALTQEPNADPPLEQDWVARCVPEDDSDVIDEVAPMPTGKLDEIAGMI